MKIIYGIDIPVKRVVNRVTYEWCIEFVDEHGDIQDHHHADKLSDLRMNFTDDDHTYHKQLVLVRDIWEVVVFTDGHESYENLEGRSWAYPVMEIGDWIMPAETDDGNCVPKRFIKEFERNNEWTHGGTRT
jgi:hypothetical protein